MPNQPPRRLFQLIFLPFSFKAVSDLFSAADRCAGKAYLVSSMTMFTGIGLTLFSAAGGSKEPVYDEDCLAMMDKEEHESCRLHSSSDPTPLFFVGGTLVAIPIASSIAVSRSGERRGLGTNRRLTILGSFAGLTGGGIAAIKLFDASSSKSRRYLMLSVATFFTGVVAGSVLGNHLQAHVRGELDSSSAGLVINF